jgi:hypothetical protein
MALYLISYDLHAAPEAQYVQLAATLREWRARKVLQSQWLIISTSPALTIVNALTPLVTAKDRILVTEITKQSAWRGTLITDADLRAWFTHARG